MSRSAQAQRRLEAIANGMHGGGAEGPHVGLDRIVEAFVDLVAHHALAGQDLVVSVPGEVRGGLRNVA